MARVTRCISEKKFQKKNSILLYELPSDVNAMTVNCFRNKMLKSPVVFGH